MLGSALGFVAGTCALLLAPRLPSAGWLLLLAAACTVAAWRLRCLAPLAFAAGVVLCQYEAQSRLADRLSVALEGERLGFEARVVSVPQSVAQGIRFRVQPLPGTGQRLPRMIELTWYEPEWIPLPAERLTLQVKLRRPRGFVNPGGNDYAARMLREGVGATGYVRAAERHGRSLPDVAAHPVLVARGEVAAVITAALGRRAATGIVAGLAVGLQDALSPEQWRTLARSGTTHLMAISGMHIGMIAAIAGWIAVALKRIRQRRGALGTTRDAALGAGVAAALMYSALAGWSVPTQRTALMILLLGLVLHQRRRIGSVQGLALAGAAVLLADPLSALAPGYWLSFGAVAALLLAGTGYRERPGVLSGFGRAQVAVTIGLVPALVASFGNVSLVSAAVNLLAVPLYTLLVVPAVLAGTLLGLVLPSVGAVALRAVAWMIEATWPLVEVPASWSWATWQVAGLPPWLWCALVCTAFAAILPLPAPGRIAALLVVAAAAAWQPVPLPEGAARLALLDVGQGLSVVVQTRRHVLVYDTGPAFRSGSDAALLVTVPYLRHRGVRAVDLLVVSHDDSDHAGGVASLLASFAVRSIAASGRLPAAPSALACVRGGSWSWDGVRFDWLHPGPASTGGDNDRSCVLRIRAGEHAALLTGDIEREGEAELIHRASPGRIDVLVVPHHGSRSSSGRALVETTRPRWALVSSGHGNRWRFPADEVVRRWNEAGARVLVSSRTGAVEFELYPGREIDPPRLARSAAPRFWSRSDVPP